MEKLSSSMTPFTKFVLPGGFLAAWPTWLYHIQDSRLGYVPAICWTVACAILLWWTAPIKKVELEEDHFLISNYLREIRVPVKWLSKIEEDQGNRTPNITLFFDPATAFGRKVRIVPLYTLWRDEKFTRVAQLLSKLAEKNRAQQNGTDDSGAASIHL
jgi:hypothetical protein